MSYRVGDKVLTEFEGNYYIAEALWVKRKNKTVLDVLFKYINTRTFPLITLVMKEIKETLVELPRGIRWEEMYERKEDIPNQLKNVKLKPDDKLFWLSWKIGSAPIIVMLLDDEKLISLERHIVVMELRNELKG